jgi:restriction system protein
MAIPDYQTLMRPLLDILVNQDSCNMAELTTLLAKQFNLSDRELNERLPSGQQYVFRSRVGWAKTYLKAAELVANETRGVVKITNQGRKFVQTHTGPISWRDLEAFDSFCEFKNKSANKTKKKPDPIIDEESERTPQERIESAFDEQKNSTTNELLDRLKTCSPSFFERVVVELLLKMGYGGIAGRGEVTRFHNDGGIDGIINQDKLGLDMVSIQAKRWEGTVGRPIVQGFVGSMDYIRARKGVIITTSKFTKDAEDYVDRIEGKKVVLIDGKELADLMIDHNLGVVVKKTYELKEVSNDFFEED